MKHRTYVSEYEQFMNGYLAHHPAVARDQLLGWRIWWERAALSPEEIAHEQAAELPRPPHSYSYD